MNCYAIVELMGHVRLVGFVTEIEHFGTKFGQIDVISRDGSTKRQIFAGGSVYRITPLADEETARTEADPHRGYRSALPAVIVSDEEEDEGEEAAEDHIPWEEML